MLYGQALRLCSGPHIATNTMIYYHTPYESEDLVMAVSYKKLWHILLDRDMKKKDLKELAGLSEYTMKRLAHNENVTTDTLAKLSRALNCSVDELVDFNDE